VLEGFSPIEKSIDISNQTCDLPACSIVLQLNTTLRALTIIIIVTITMAKAATATNMTEQSDY
jgi:hypothetical protein